MATIPSNLNIPTAAQLPDHSILDLNGKQTYLGNQFAVTLPSTSISGTSEQALILVSNPVTISSKNNLKSLFVNLRKLIPLTASDTAILRVYVAPTATAGTPTTPQNLRPASGNASVATASTAPTASANGTLVEVLASTADLASISNMPIVLDPGQSMLVTIQVSASSSISAQLSWYEL